MAYSLLVPLGALTILALVLRWALKEHSDKAHRKDYGLLREIAKVPSSTAARVVEQRLLDAGVRATTVPAEDGGGMRILVFPGDEATAINALLSYE